MSSKKRVALSFDFIVVRVKEDKIYVCSPSPPRP